MTLTQHQLDQVATRVALRNEFNRRRFLSMASGAVAISFGGGLLSACGNDDETGGQLTSGTIKLGGYPDWIGKGNLPAFAEEHPGDQVEQVSIPVDEDRIAKLATDPQAVDLMLITEKDVQRLVDLDVAAEVDLDSVPNYANIDEEFKFGLREGFERALRDHRLRQDRVRLQARHGRRGSDVMG